MGIEGRAGAGVWLFWSQACFSPTLPPHHRGTAAPHGPQSLSDCVLVPLVAPNSPLVKEAGPNSMVKIFLLTS